MQKALRINLNYQPRTWQHAAHLGLKNKKTGLWICCRQVGKTIAAIAELCDRSLKGPLNSNTCYCCPAQSQARRIAWPLIKERLRPLGDQVTFMESQLCVILPGDRRIYLLGAENENARGSSFHTLIIDERDSISDQFMREVLLPTINAWGENAFVLYIGTLAGGVSHLYNMYLDHRDSDDWDCRIVNAVDAGVFTPEWLEHQKQVLGLPAFQREMMCDPNAPVENSVLGREMTEAERDGRVERLPYPHGYRVHTSWDLGIRDFTTVWGCIHHGQWIEFLFYREFSELGIIEIAMRLQEEFPQYKWGEATLPHDGKNRDKGSGISVDNTLRDNFPGTVFSMQSAPSPVATLQASRKWFSSARFDQRGCEKGIARLKAARYVIEPKTGTVRDQILHDDNSHCIDAFRLGMWRLAALGTEASNTELRSEQWTSPARYYE